MTSGRFMLMRGDKYYVDHMYLNLISSDKIKALENWQSLCYKRKLKIVINLKKEFKIG